MRQPRSATICKMKSIDSQSYLDMLRELAEEGKLVSMAITGSSMSPFLIHQRDSISFSKPGRELRKGDMVFFRRRDGQYVMHRICRVEGGNYYMIGDAQTVVEGPVGRGQIFALVTKVRRKGKWIGPGDFLWEFFACVWLDVIPLRRGLIALYRHLHK